MSTDVIVGFPGESEEQFEKTFNMLRELRSDTVHVACYSPRPGTIAARKLRDDVPAEEKRKRRERIEVVQERIASEINSQLLNQTVEILVEGRKRGRLWGRTRTNKLVFFSDEADCLGERVRVKIEKTSPWAFQGSLV
jgi:tRNA-2-methylthio-N6-dimethylallyladenosine synthase